MYIPQYHLKNISKYLKSGKALIIYGPRRCGKTTLLKEASKSFKEKYLFVSGEDMSVQDYLTSCSIEKLRGFIGNNKTLLIDEAQRVRGIGLNIKLILDHIKGIKVVASGSSSFDLAKEVGEPLTGRKYTLKLFPLSQMELGALETLAQTTSRLESRLIYGSYPEVIVNKGDSVRKDYLREIVSSYLYKDILELEGVRHSDKLARLLQLLAFQIGKEVSYTELGGHLAMSKNTIERYLDLLEKSFVVFKMTGFSRNLRKEIVKNPRYYFVDCGIRNALINNFNPLSMRDDAGMLWENYIVVEMLKKQEYKRLHANNYFWRTYDRKEIDLVEERGGKLYGYEIKWGKYKPTPPKEWRRAYKNSVYKVITPANYLDFVV